MLDLALISDRDTADPQLKDLIMIYSHRLNLMKKQSWYLNSKCLESLMALDVKQQKLSVNMAEAIVRPIRKMMVASEMGNLEIFEYLERIDHYVQDEDAVCKLLFSMPNIRQGLGCLLEGLFSSNTEIAVLTAKILNKLQRCQMGRIALQSNMNLFYELRLSEILG